MIEVIVPVHNRREMTLECLRQLFAQTGSDFHVTIIDDGSTDGTSEAIAESYPQVTVLPGDGSLWWAASINLGVEHVLSLPTPPEFILLLNDDVGLPETYIAVLQSCARQHPRSLVGSLAVYIEDPERVQWCGAAASHRECTVGYVPRSSLSDWVAAETLSGRGMFIPSEVFALVGYMDADTFPQYFADGDFSLRAKKAGYGLIACCDTQIAVMTRETGAGSVHLDESLLDYLWSYFDDRSQNYLPMLWHFYTRHGDVKEFAIQVGRRVTGNALRRLGVWKRPQ